jgi:pyrroloquinoline quinone (PQQ) biosynthesis protein C
MTAMDTLPLLRRTAKVSDRNDQVAIEYLTNEIVLDGAAAKLFRKIKPHLDGKTRLDRIAERVSEPTQRVAALANQLKSTGVLGFADDAQRMTTGPEFYELHRKYCTTWLQPVYEHPLWQKLTTGTASRAQVLGFAFEKYHYIEGAYEHMAIGAANATPEMMPHLAEHFIEEYNHGDIYRRGLRSLFPNDTVLQAQPLPSTRALVNFLSESAGRNSFGYYAGNELLQMTENTSDPAGANSIDSFYDLMRKHYPYTDKLIDSFIAHTKADQSLGHENVFLKMCGSVPPMSMAEVKDAMNIVRMMAEHLALFMDGIDAQYASFPLIPRTPCTLLSE